MLRYGRPILGSIPAGAGEPLPKTLIGPICWVYPRGCGGAFWRSIFVFKRRGLSPRVRGSPSGRWEAASALGSIPAGAGEPQTGPILSSWWRVYPRGCGGAYGVAITKLRAAGLSPRVRGSLVCRTNAMVRDGSIPAGAGEPQCCPMKSTAYGVYPRGCGGAQQGICVDPGRAGLSPRVRGSHRIRPA